MRIGLITGEYPPMEGGVGAYTHELARALTACGHTVFVLTDSRVPSREVDHVHVTGSVNSWNYATLFTIRVWAKQHQLDVINIQYEAAAFKMAQLIHLLPLLLRPCITVTTYHDLLVPYLFPKAGPLRFQAVLALAKASHGVIVTNRQDEQRLRAANISRIRTIPIGSNIAVSYPKHYDRSTWRSALDIPSDAVLVGYFGFMNATKGVDTLLRGVAQAVENGLNVYLLLIGGRTGASDPTNARQAQEIDRLIVELGLEKRVKWTGFVDGSLVSANLTACDVVALPFRDGVSFRRGSFMAALAHGCAIITTAPDSEITEIVDGENVLLIPRDDPASLAAALSNLATNRQLRAKLQQGAVRLADLFTWDKIAAQTVVFFEALKT